MADSFKVVFKEEKNPYSNDTNSRSKGDIYEARNNICFAGLNNLLSSYKQDIESVYIIIEAEKHKEFTEDYVTTFLDNISKIGTIGYDYELVNGNYLIKLNLDEIKCPNHNKFVTTALRCLYEPKKSDGFKLIGKHFVNLCKFFPDEDRGKLFCIASNIYCYSDGYNGVKDQSGYHKFNNNHLHIMNVNCKILKSEDIKKALNDLTMHGVFRPSEDVIDDKYKQDLLEETLEGYKAFL